MKTKFLEKIKKRRFGTSRGKGNTAELLDLSPIITSQYSLNIMSNAVFVNLKNTLCYIICQKRRQHSKSIMTIFSLVKSEINVRRDEFQTILLKVISILYIIQAFVDPVNDNVSDSNEICSYSPEIQLTHFAEHSFLVSSIILTASECAKMSPLDRLEAQGTIISNLDFTN